VAETIEEMRHQVVEDMCHRHMPEKAYADAWNTTELTDEIAETLGLQLPIKEWADAEGAATEEVTQKVQSSADDFFKRKTAQVGEERMRWLEKQILLQEVDVRWREHLSHLDQLRSVIHLRGYAQRDPLNEFKTEAFTLFETLLGDLRRGVTRVLMRGQFVVEQPPSQGSGEGSGGPGEPPPQISNARPAPAPQAAAPAREPAAASADAHPEWSATPRNSPCPCGSGKRYKNCHGDVTAVARA
jgi:preprotein translocase subunit SecA